MLWTIGFDAVGSIFCTTESIGTPGSHSSTSDSNTPLRESPGYASASDVVQSWTGDATSAPTDELSLAGQVDNDEDALDEPIAKSLRLADPHIFARNKADA